MQGPQSRRSFFSQVGHGTLWATLGSAAVDMGFVSSVFAEDLDGRLEFGALEPLVSALQETLVDRLQSLLAEQLRAGVSLQRLVAGAALANARTFGGEDYIGFHTFMALAPAWRMSRLMPAGSEALPVFKVLYRNTQRIQEFGGSSAEVLHRVNQLESRENFDEQRLRHAILARKTGRAEQTLAAMMANNRQLGLDALIPVVQDNPEVHRTVLPYRAWEMQEVVGTEHAVTLLRQSLRYCVRATSKDAEHEMSAQAKMLAALFDEFKLEGRAAGTKPVEDSVVEQLSSTFATATPTESARAAAAALADGLAPSAIGEALSLAASLLVLRDGGRLPQWEDKLKPAGCVHGDSVGVHASDAANAWRNLATVCTGRNQYACLIIGAWQVARDRDGSPNLMPEPLPARGQIDRITASDADQLLTQLIDCVQSNLQGQATAIVHRYCQSSAPAELLFANLVRFAVSEDGALHAEKYFHTVWDDFHATRPSLRSRHLMALARVTASEYGTPAAGQHEARRLLDITS